MAGARDQRSLASDAGLAQQTLSTVSVGEHFEITPDGLNVKGQPSFEACEMLWEMLRTLERSIQFAIGDAIKYFKKRWGERAYQIISVETGWAESTVKAYEWTSESVPKEVRRMDVLDYSHHQAVAKLPPKEQKQYLDRAAEGDEKGKWSVTRLKQAVKAGGDVAVTAYYALVRCKSEQDRDGLIAELERRGYICKATEKRGGEA